MSRLLWPGSPRRACRSRFAGRSVLSRLPPELWKYEHLPVSLAPGFLRERAKSVERWDALPVPRMSVGHGLPPFGLLTFRLSIWPEPRIGRSVQPLDDVLG